LKEVQLVADRSPRVAPSSILRMATIDAAAALGIEQAFGSIAPGKRAHLATSPCNASAVSDPYDAIVTPGTTLTPLTID
jgi:imidazolonepropionase-like amidohydrolase